MNLLSAYPNAAMVRDEVADFLKAGGLDFEIATASQAPRFVQGTGNPGEMVYLHVNFGKSRTAHVFLTEPGDLHRSYQEVAAATALSEPFIMISTFPSDYMPLSAQSELHWGTMLNLSFELGTEKIGLILLGKVPQKRLYLQQRSVHLHPELVAGLRLRPPFTEVADGEAEERGGGGGWAEAQGAFDARRRAENTRRFADADAQDVLQREPVDAAAAPRAPPHSSHQEMIAVHRENSELLLALDALLFVNHHYLVPRGRTIELNQETVERMMLAMVRVMKQEVPPSDSDDGY
jgi:hypothetical protein